VTSRDEVPFDLDQRWPATADYRSPGGTSVDTCYFSIIERADDGCFTAWVPDLPGVTADGETEAEVLRRVFRSARECLRNLIVISQPLPEARPLEELPQRQEREFRRLLLVVS